MIIISGCRGGGGGRRAGIGGLALTNRSGYLEYIARIRDEKRKSKKDGSDTESKERILEQRLQLETSGYAYHPNLLDFTLAGLFGLRQYDFEEIFGGQTKKSGDDGDILEFDFSGTMFREKKYPLWFFARRNNTVEPRAFRVSIDTTSTSYGFTWSYNSLKMPTRLSFSDTTVDQDPFLKAGETQSGTRKNSNLRFETAYVFNEHNKISLTLGREIVDEQPLDTGFDTDTLALVHRLDFGEDHRHRLESRVDYFNQTGTINNERLRLQESLRLKHSDTLRTSYILEYLDRTQGTAAGAGTVNQKTVRLSGQLEHRLYESLVSQFSGYVQSEDFDTGLNIERFGVSARFDYNKRNRWGTLRLNYAFSFDYENRTGGDATFEVIDTKHTFKDPEPIVLTDANIERSSITILSEGRLQIYQEGRDYLVQVIGDRVEIERVVTGLIEDGETVLLSYVFRIFGSFKFDTVAHYFGIRQDFALGLAAYYRFQWQDQTIVPANAVGITLEDIVGHTAGIEYRHKALRLSAEWEDHDSTIEPFSATRFGAEISHRFKTGANTSFGIRWTDMSFRPPRLRDTTLLTIDGRYKHPITKTLEFEGHAAYRDVKDTLSSDYTGLDVDLSLRWDIRETEVELTYKFLGFEDDFTDNDSTFVFVRVRRRF